MQGLNIRTQLTETLARLAARVLAMAHTQPRLSAFIQRIPLLA
ncbi:MAG: hypothetical protein ACR2IK_18530 [Chloroflexota bacterium]